MSLDPQALAATAEGAASMQAPVAAVVNAVSRGYGSSEEHLWHTLERIDRLVRAQVVRWRANLAAHKPSSWWGMLQVTDAEIDAVIDAPFAPLDRPPAALVDVLRPHWAAAEVLAADIRRRVAATPEALPLRLARIGAAFGLSDLEIDVLLVCLLPELDARYRRLYGYLLDDASRTRPTVELILEILQPCVASHAEGRAVFQPPSPLRRHRLIEVDGATAAPEPLVARSVRLDDRIGAFLLGDDAIDPRLVGVLEAATRRVAWEARDGPADGDPVRALRAVAVLWQARRAGARARLEHRADGTGSGGDAARGTPMVVLLHGPRGSGRRDGAAAICTATDTPLLVADVASGLAAGQDGRQVIALCYREARLRGAALYWAGAEPPREPAASGDHGAAPRLRDEIAAAAVDHPVLTFLEGATAWDPTGGDAGRCFWRVDFPHPGFAARRRLWEARLSDLASLATEGVGRAAVAEALANAFRLTAGEIRDAARAAEQIAALREPERPQVTLDDLREGCRREAGRRLPRFARRVLPREPLSFGDLVLPASNKRQVEELRARVRHAGRVHEGLGVEARLSLGKGLIALFTGASGTGKTMAAELLAREQGVDLYKVDLSAVVSKYVGETEKHLNVLFDEAADANAVLLFDECDALFGKRGEVKEAQDRWANMEVNYLLQRVEEYSGVVILTSNLRQNIDDAFLRRIHVIIDFPFPDAEGRARILAGLFPPGLEIPPEPELRRLAEQFHLAGGHWRNIVVDAVFRAVADAGEGGGDRTWRGVGDDGRGGARPVVTARHLSAAVAREFQKQGRPITVSDFGAEWHGWVKEDVLFPGSGAASPNGSGRGNGRKR